MGVAVGASRAFCLDDIAATSTRQSASYFNVHVDYSLHSQRYLAKSGEIDGASSRRQQGENRRQITRKHLDYGVNLQST